MSLYVEWINSIKQHSNSKWLTENQETIFTSIINNWKSEPFICLHGSSGCGKTFIGHLLEKEYGYKYTQNLGSVEEGYHNLVLDGEEYNRLMRPLILKKGWKRIIVLSRRQARDPMPSLHLTLSDRDIRQFQNILTRNNIIPSFQCSSNSTDLHNLIQNEAVKRGS